ncbi:MAG TPA: hypothetical protein V6D20_08320 [Candidatus Obscuribacterales bacterium]
MGTSFTRQAACPHAAEVRLARVGGLTHPDRHVGDRGARQLNGLQQLGTWLGRSLPFYPWFCTSAV